MPELPEVETLRRQLQDALPGRTIVDCQFSGDRPSLVRSPNEEAFARAIAGRMIERVRRRGKWLFLDLSGSLVLVAHLRMTGRWLLRRADAEEDPYLRARITLDTGDELRWCDVRKFGTWDLVRDAERLTGTIGPEPLDPSFGSSDLLKSTAGRRAPIKAFLLDQRRVAGLGNIYVDEALWNAGIHPLRAAGSLTADQAARLHAAIVDVLRDAIENGGSSMRDYLDTAGRRGRVQHRWAVYKREGTPCRRCGAQIAKTRVSGRGTRFCPTCQPVPQDVEDDSVS